MNPDSAKTANELIKLLHILGFSVAWSKIVCATQQVTFLGLLLDSSLMEVRLPPHKLEGLHNVISSFTKRRYATKRQLQSLCGTLAHCSAVVRGGRTFSRRVIDLMKSVDRNEKVKLNEEFRKDIAWWSDFASWFNGKAKVLTPDAVCAPEFQCDSSLLGYGIFYGVFLIHFEA